jgi:FkbM family methyltransferase
MQKIFLDIGAHTGETLAEVIKPLYGFDRIVAFEPSSACLPALEALAAQDPRIELCRFGLGDGRQQLTLYGTGLDSASTLPGEAGSGASTDSSRETVQLEDASSWVREHLSPGDLIVAKLNCEGGEVAILRSWIRSGLLDSFYSVMITFDIRNFKALRHQEGELRAELRRLNRANTCFADDVMRGPSHGQRLAHWLGLFGLDQPNLPSLLHYRSSYARPLARYARKRGYRPRAELVLKEYLGYGALPGPAKAVLRGLKARLGLSAEQV